MDIEKFIRLRKYLYHLTDVRNVDSILSDYMLKSTTTLVHMIGVPNQDEFLRTRRVGHKHISNGKVSILLRDQDPLSEKITMKNLEQGMTFGDFVYLLNSRVFFWAKEGDMIGHYARYVKQNEYPVIFRVRSEELFAANNYGPKFCRLNSGAPRCSSHYDEGAPPRGRNTFLSSDFYDRIPSSIREVTFENQCKLPKNLFLARSPNAIFKAI